MTPSTFSDPFPALREQWQRDQERKSREMRGNDLLRDGLRSQGGRSGQFADVSQDRFGQLGGEMNALRGQLGELAQGKDSISAEQLRQALQQQLAQQRSAVAGAGPNAAMAARTAMNNMGRASYGMAGQQAQAGIAERNAAMQQLAQLLMGQRGQDLQATLGGRGLAIQGLGGAVNPQDDKSWAERNAAWLGGLSSLGGVLAGR